MWELSCLFFFSGEFCCFKKTLHGHQRQVKLFVSMAYYNLRNKTKRNETKRNENLYFAKKNYFETQENKRAWVSFIFLANVIFYLETYSDTFHVHFQRFSLFIDNVHWLHPIDGTDICYLQDGNMLMICKIEICNLRFLFSKSLAYFHFANYRFSFLFVSFRFANYCKAISITVRSDLSDILWHIDATS